MFQLKFSIGINCIELVIGEKKLLATVKAWSKIKCEHCMDSVASWKFPGDGNCSTITTLTQSHINSTFSTFVCLILSLMFVYALNSVCSYAALSAVYLACNPRKSSNGKCKISFVQHDQRKTDKLASKFNLHCICKRDKILNRRNRRKGKEYEKGSFASAFHVEVCTFFMNFFSRMYICSWRWTLFKFSSKVRV